MMQAPNGGSYDFKNDPPPMEDLSYLKRGSNYIGGDANGDIDPQKPGIGTSTGNMQGHLPNGAPNGVDLPAEELNEVVVKGYKAPSYFKGYYDGPNSGEYGPSSMNPDATSFSLSGEANSIFGKGSFTVGVAFNRFGTDGGFYYSGNGSFGLTAELPSFGIGLEFNSHNNYGGNKDVIEGIGGTDLMYSGSLGLGGAYGRTADRSSQGGYKWAESGVSTTTFNIGIGGRSFHKNIETGNIIKFSEIAKYFKP